MLLNSPPYFLYSARPGNYTHRPDNGCNRNGRRRYHICWQVPEQRKKIISRLGITGIEEPCAVEAFHQFRMTFHDRPTSSAFTTRSVPTGMWTKAMHDIPCRAYDIRQWQKPTDHNREVRRTCRRRCCSLFRSANHRSHHRANGPAKAPYWNGQPEDYREWCRFLLLRETAALAVGDMTQPVQTVIGGEPDSATSVFDCAWIYEREVTDKSIDNKMLLPIFICYLIYLRTMARAFTGSLVVMKSAPSLE